MVPPVRTDELDYDLPEAAIAQRPIEPRDSARLLCDHGGHQPVEHRHVRDLPGLVGAGDVVVVNDTRVRRARLHLHKDTGAEIEVLLLEPVDGEADWWQALIRPSRRVAPGTRLTGEGVTVEVAEAEGGGRWTVVVRGEPDLAGEIPLPPYIRLPLDDPERYQTVYSRRAASAAAPTAGLHLTPEVLAGVRASGATVASVELVVGLDTFRPVTEATLDEHEIHTESYSVPDATMHAVQRADRVIAVGTTSVRALETVAATGALQGRTDLFIQRGFAFKTVDVMLTNFHMPRTTLLAMIDAFVGPRWRDLYAVALREGYRFLSFGDAMWLARSA